MSEEKSVCSVCGNTKCQALIECNKIISTQAAITKKTDRDNELKDFQTSINDATTLEEIKSILLTFIGKSYAQYDIIRTEK